MIANDEIPESPARSIPWRICIALLLATGVISLIVGQLRVAHDGLSPRALIPYLAGGIAIAGAAGVARDGRILNVWRARVTGRESTVPIWLIGSALVSSLFAFGRSWFRSSEQSATDITAFWLLGIALLVFAACGGTNSRHLVPMIGQWKRWRPPASEHRIPTWLIVILAAALPRLIMLDRFPTILENDEGYFLERARSALQGDIANPFAANIQLMPDTIAIVQGWVAYLFGESIAVYRLPSATIGVLSIIAVWLIGRRLFGEAIGVSAAVILSFMPLHLWASRNGMNNITDAASIAFALFFLDRTLVHRRRLDAVLCGIAAGFGWHGYYGGRLVIVIPIVALVCITVIRSEVAWSLADCARFGGWIVAGFFASIAPILGYYGNHQDILVGRFRVVESRSDDPRTVVEHLDLILRALVYPLTDQTQVYGFYRFGPPFLGWIVAPLVVVGAIVWIGWVLQGLRSRQMSSPRPMILLVAWLIIAAGVAQTEGMQAQRQLGLTVIWALAASTGLVSVIGAVRVAAGLRLRTANLVLLAALALISLWLSDEYFTERQQIRNYGDIRTTIAWDIGWRLDTLPGNPNMIFAGTPSMSYGGFRNWRYLAPEQGTQLLELPSWDAPEYVTPTLAPDQLAVFTYERSLEEICTVQDANPEALIGEVRNREGALLYTVFSTGRDLILPITETPGQTTLTPIPQLSCQGVER